VSLRAAIDNVRLLLAHRLKAEQVAFVVDVSPPLLVCADSTRLEQVLLNLASNALDAMSGVDNRRLAIAARAESARVVVSVTDTGAGMTAEQSARLFEPFFTTKPAGQGLGLGLVISSKIVTEFGGALRAYPGQPQGMVFEFDLKGIRSQGNVRGL
jgi:two-component system, NtrC family, C4-dicarboxylate transport sensor histidine kinase DctB